MSVPSLNYSPKPETEKLITKLAKHKELNGEDGVSLGRAAEILGLSKYQAKNVLLAGERTKKLKRTGNTFGARYFSRS